MSLFRFLVRDIKGWREVAESLYVKLFSVSIPNLSVRLLQGMNFMNHNKRALDNITSCLSLFNQAKFTRICN